MTCSRFSLLKTLLMATEANFPLQRLCLKPSSYGRFWVITEGSFCGLYDPQLAKHRRQPQRGSRGGAPFFGSMKTIYEKIAALRRTHFMFMLP